MFRYNLFCEHYCQYLFTLKQQGCSGGKRERDVLDDLSVTTQGTTDATSLIFIFIVKLNVDIRSEGFA